MAAWSHSLDLMPYSAPVMLQMGRQLEGLWLTFTGVRGVEHLHRYGIAHLDVSCCE